MKTCPGLVPVQILLKQMLWQKSIHPRDPNAILKHLRYIFVTFLSEPQSSSN